jgi:tetratricopeptide (TPR) repeat protein
VKVQTLISLLALSSVAIPAWAAPAEPDMSKKPASGVQWTKIQDLNPNATTTNRPIKQKWAVVIGAAKFKESKLDGMDSKMDVAARNFASYLKDPAAGRFPESHVKTLINSDATKQNIINNLGKGWLGSLAGPDDLAVVFISTHGFPTTDGSTYLSAYDCALDNVYSTCLSMQTLMDTLKKDVKTDRIVMILESPYSGAAELTSGAKALFKGSNLDASKVAIGKGYIILTSSKPDQMTWGNSFSNNLIKALRDKDGMQGLTEAFNQARTMTENDTALGNASSKKQTPVMKSDWTGNDIVLGAPTVEQVKEIPENVMAFVAAEAHYLKANNLVGEGNFDGAIAEYKAAIETEPDYADAVADYGAILTVKGDWAGAAEKYKRAIELKPNDALFHANYARVLTKLGQEDASVKELELAYQLNPKDRVILGALANKCISAGNLDNAITLLEQAIYLFPQSAQMHDRLSYVFAKNGNISQSFAHAKEAVKLDPKLVSARLNLGSAYLLRGDADSAKQVYIETSTLDPKNVDVHYLLASTMEKLGDNKGAKAALSKFVDLAPAQDPRVNTAKEKLKSLGN